MKCASISASPVFAEPLHVAEQIRVVRIQPSYFGSLTARIASSFRHLRSSASCFATFETSVMYSFSARTSSLVPSRPPGPGWPGINRSHARRRARACDDRPRLVGQHHVRLLQLGELRLRVAMRDERGAGVLE